MFSKGEYYKYLENLAKETFLVCWQCNLLSWTLPLPMHSTRIFFPFVSSGKSYDPASQKHGLTVLSARGRWGFTVGFGTGGCSWETAAATPYSPSQATGPAWVMHNPPVPSLPGFLWTQGIHVALVLTPPTGPLSSSSLPLSAEGDDSSCTFTPEPGERATPENQGFSVGLTKSRHWFMPQNSVPWYFRALNFCISIDISFLIVMSWFWIGGFIHSSINMIGTSLARRWSSLFGVDVRTVASEVTPTIKATPHTALVLTAVAFRADLPAPLSFS